MSKKYILALLSVFAVVFFLLSSLAIASSQFTNNCGQSAQGLKLTFDGNITINDIGGGIFPFTVKAAWGPGNGIWLSGGTLPNGGNTQCFTYPQALTITSASWTTGDINTVIGNALNGELSCSAPSLTQWGIIALIGLLLASTVFIMLRRMKTRVPA